MSFRPDKSHTHDEPGSKQNDITIYAVIITATFQIVHL